MKEEVRHSIAPSQMKLTKENRLDHHRGGHVGVQIDFVLLPPASQLNDSQSDLQIEHHHDHNLAHHQGICMCVVIERFEVLVCPERHLQ